MDGSLKKKGEGEARESVEGKTRISLRALQWTY